MRKSCKYFKTCGSNENCKRCNGYQKDYFSLSERDRGEDHKRGLTSLKIPFHQYISETYFNVKKTGICIWLPKKGLSGHN